jgi:hypothetical protein
MFELWGVGQQLLVSDTNLFYTGMAGVIVFLAGVIGKLYLAGRTDWEKRLAERDAMWQARLDETNKACAAQLTEKDRQIEIWRALTNRATNVAETGVVVADRLFGREKGE